MNIKNKSKSKMNNTKSYINKTKKIRKKSPKIIDYNKVVQKYGNLLETSLNTSNSTTQQQKALNSNNNYDDSYYDYIIDNIYETNNINQLKQKEKQIENNKNDDTDYYFTFKQKKLSTINNDIIKYNNNTQKYKNRAPISIISNKEEINKYFNDRNILNNANNISSIKNYNNNYNTFSKQIKKTKSLKTNMTYKNDIMTEKNKKIEKIIYTNFKTNKSCNNIKNKEIRKINNDVKDLKYIKDKLIAKKLSRINSQENNFSKKFNFNNNADIYQNIKYSESIHVHGNESIKEDILNKNKSEYNTNIKFKEKVLLLLNLCRKYAYKFNKLFPLCESALSNKDKNQSFIDLKNTINQFNNMIFNQNISKIFDLNENQKDLLNLLNNDESQKIKELSQQLDNFKKNEIIQQKKLDNLSQKIQELNNEIESRDNIIKDLKNKLYMKQSNKIKEFNGLEKNNENNDDIKINMNIKSNENNSNKKSNKKETNKNININSYNKVSNKSKNNNKKFQIDEIKNNIKNINFDIIDENQPLNTEIEKLDQEIYNLKSKLKKIIKK